MGQRGSAVGTGVQGGGRDVELRLQAQGRALLSAGCSSKDHEIARVAVRSARLKTRTSFQCKAAKAEGGPVTAGRV